MICFALELNGRPLVTAGIAGNGVLTAIATWVQRRPRSAKKQPERELTLSLTGLDSNSESNDGTHLGWVNQQLKVGDVVMVRVLDQEASDQPTSRRPSMSPSQMASARVQSAKAYLKEYRRQRARLDLMISDLEKVAKGKTPTSRRRAQRLL